MFIFIVACNNIFFLWLSTTQLNGYTSFFVRSLTYGHSSCFYLLTMMEGVAVNNPIPVARGHMLSSLGANILGEGHEIVLYLTLCHTVVL